MLLPPLANHGLMFYIILKANLPQNKRGQTCISEKRGQTWISVEHAPSTSTGQAWISVEHALATATRQHGSELHMLLKPNLTQNESRQAWSRVEHALANASGKALIGIIHAA